MAINDPKAPDTINAWIKRANAYWEKRAAQQRDQQPARKGAEDAGGLMEEKKPDSSRVTVEQLEVVMSRYRPYSFSL